MELTISKKYQDLVNRMLNNTGVRYIILSGGRGSGKTFIAYKSLVMRAAKMNNEVGIIAKYTLKGMQKSVNDIINEFSYLPNVSMTKTEIKYKQNLYYLDGLKTNSPSKLKSISNLSLVIVDEAQDINKYDEFSIVDKSIRGGIDRLSMLIFNPTTKYHWIYEHFCQAPNYETVTFDGKEYYIPKSSNSNVLHIHTTFLDLPDCKGKDDIYKDALILKQMNEKMFIYEYLGVPIDSQNELIYRFKRIKEQEFDYSLPSFIGVDFGYKDETAIVACFIDVSALRIYVKELYYKSNTTYTDVKDAIIKFYKTYNTKIVCDTSALQISQELKNIGLPIYYKNQKIKLHDRILKMKDFVIYTDSNNVINECLNYYYDETKTIKTKKDHLLDAIHYACIDYILHKTVER